MNYVQAIYLCNTGLWAICFAVICERNPCKNAGTCSVGKDNKATCTCSSEFVGEFCEKGMLAILNFTPIQHWTLLEYTVLPTIAYLCLILIPYAIAT